MTSEVASSAQTLVAEPLSPLPPQVQTDLIGASYCGWLCVRVWDVVLCALLALPLVCVDARGLFGCRLLSSDFVDDRTSYCRVLVAVFVGEAAACCLLRVDVLHLFVLSLDVALVWLMLLLLLLRLLLSN